MVNSLLACMCVCVQTSVFGSMMSHTRLPVVQFKSEEIIESSNSSSFCKLFCLARDILSSSSTVICLLKISLEQNINSTFSSLIK